MFIRPEVKERKFPCLVATLQVTQNMGLPQVSMRWKCRYLPRYENSQYLPCQEDNQYLPRRRNNSFPKTFDSYYIRNVFVWC